MAETGYKLTVLYGTETGNSRGIADKVAKKGEKNGVEVTVRDLAGCDVDVFDGIDHPVLVVISTWDDGVPPPKAAGFCKSLIQTDKDLSGVRYTVLALGDKEYPQFCACGRMVDERLAAMGAERVLDRGELGADFMVSYIGWSKTFWKTMAGVYGVNA